MVVLSGVLQVTPIPSTRALLAGGEMVRGTGQRGIQAARRAGARVGAGSATGERGLAEKSRAHGAQLKQVVDPPGPAGCKAPGDATLALSTSLWRRMGGDLLQAQERMGHHRSPPSPAISMALRFPG